jgi:DNA-binding winged helix-turn-helix (wHTH) protein
MRPSGIKRPMVYEFGPFRLDSAKRRLWRDGEIVPLTPKALETLIVLVSRAGAVVEKDELLKSVWPDTFVEEATLAQNVSTLRKALGETSETPTYISTVPRRGYRFLSNVTDGVAGSVKEAAAPDATISALPITTSRSQTKSRLWAVAVAGAVLSVIVAIGVRAIRGKPEILTPVVFTIWPPEGSRFSTSGGFMAVSPDGRHVAFVATDLEGTDRLWTRSIASPVPRPLAGAEGAFQPFWSADSKFIAFFADGKLKKNCY